MAREQVRHGVVVDDRGAAGDSARRCWSASRSRSTRAPPVGELRLGQQQIVEIARALAQDARVLIMDEPTSALSAAEVEVLFRIIRELTADGVAIVYISHHLEEALEIADRVVVLRDGRLVAEAEAAERRPRAGSSSRWSAAARTSCSPTSMRETGDELLRVARAERRPTRATRAGCRSTASRLTVRAGEIVGLYGLMGAGRTELLEALAGRLRAGLGRDRASTATLVDGRRSPTGSRAGSRSCPRIASATGSCSRCRSGQNLSLAGLRRFIRGPLVSRERERAAVDDDDARRHGQGRRAGRADHVAERRQPAEGRARQGAADRAARAAARRADARHRRRRQGRHLHADDRASPGAGSRCCSPPRSSRRRCTCPTGCW